MFNEQFSAGKGEVGRSDFVAFADLHSVNTSNCRQSQPISRASLNVDLERNGLRHYKLTLTCQWMDVCLVFSPLGKGKDHLLLTIVYISSVNKKKGERGSQEKGGLIF